MSILNYIGKQFRQPAGIGGRIISALMKKGNIHAYEHLLPVMKLDKVSNILEIGYGHGLGIQRICNENTCHVTGVDFSELMFKEASRRNKRFIADKRVELHYGDYHTHMFDANSFDCIFFINVIYFWNDLEASFGKLYKELKGGGTLYIYMAHGDELKKLKFTTDDIFNKYTIEDVVEDLTASGFKDVSYSYNKGYFIQCLK